MFVSIALIHSSARLVPLLTDVAREVMADVHITHMVDEGLWRLIDEAGEITEPVTRRLCSYAMNAQEAGAEGIMLTSPSLGPVIDVVRAAVRIPAIRIDEAMVETAVQFAGSVGVLAAQDITLKPTLALLRERADARGRAIQFEAALCEDARVAFESGDLDAYDRIVLDAVLPLARNDMIVLADVMMHRVVQEAGERTGVPVVASPRLGFELLARKLNYFRR